MQHTDLIVIGGGIAGSAAALRAAQNGLRFSWIYGDKQTRKASRAQWVANVDNMIGVHPDLLRAKVAKALRAFPEARAFLQSDDFPQLEISTRDIVSNARARVEAWGQAVTLIDERATAACRQGDDFVISTPSGDWASPHVVLATGVMDRHPKIKLSKGDAVIDDIKWVYPFANRESLLYCIRCEGHLTQDQRAGVIGAGNGAAEIAMMLYERYGSAIAIFTNGEPPSWSEARGQVLDRYGVQVHAERIVALEGKKGELNAITLEGGAQVGLRYAFVSVGIYRVYNDLARALGATLTNPEQPLEQRHVQIDHRGETSVSGLFAVGDMTRHADRSVMKQIYTSQEYAVRAVDAIDWRVRRPRRGL